MVCSVWCEEGNRGASGREWIWVCIKKESPRRVRGLQRQGWATTTTWAGIQGASTHTSLAACALPHPPSHSTPPSQSTTSHPNPCRPDPCIPSPRIRAAGAPPADCIQSPSGLSTALWPILTLSCRQSGSASLVVTEPTSRGMP